jgi:flagellar assembly protein FliH
MHWSKAVIKSNFEVTKVVDFEPPKLNLGVPSSALQFYGEKAKLANTFKMNPAIKIQTGLDRLEASDLESRIESMVLERLQAVQESAYNEAYALGLEEGRARGFESQTMQIESRIKEISGLILGIT